MLEKWLGITIVVTNLFSQCWPPNWTFDIFTTLIQIFHIDFLKNKYWKHIIHVTNSAIVGITILYYFYCYFMVFVITFKKYCRAISHAVQTSDCRR